MIDDDVDDDEYCSCSSIASNGNANDGFDYSSVVHVYKRRENDLFAAR